MSNEQLQKLLKEADHKKVELDSFRPLPGDLIKELNQWFKVELAFSISALEGGTLTSNEVGTIIEKNLSVEGKSLTDHLKIVGYADAIEYIFDLAKCNACDLTYDNIINIYKLAFDRINADGSYEVKSSSAIDQFVASCPTTNRHPIIFATDVHIKIMQLKPFTKGNKAIGQLLMNLVLLQKGYCPIIIWPEDQARYIQLLNEAEMNDKVEPLYQFIASKVIASLDLYLAKVK